MKPDAPSADHHRWDAPKRKARSHALYEVASSQEWYDYGQLFLSDEDCHEWLCGLTKGVRSQGVLAYFDLVA